MYIHTVATSCVLFFTCKREKYTVFIQHYIQDKIIFVLVFQQKLLLGVVALDTWMLIPIHSSPKPQVNCPILHDIVLTPPLATMEPAYLITSLISHTHMQYMSKQRGHCQIGAIHPIQWFNLISFRH